MRIGIDISLAQPGTSGDREEQQQTAIAAVTAPAFQTASARDKQDILWSYLGWPYQQLPSMHWRRMQTMSRLIKRAFLRKAFVQDDDVRPPRPRPFMRSARRRDAFVADGTHPFTGVFATGGVGFMRASLAVGMPVQSGRRLQFLIDGPRAHRRTCCCISRSTRKRAGIFLEGLQPITLWRQSPSEYAHAAALEILASPISSNRIATFGSSRGCHEQRHRRRTRRRPWSGCYVCGRRGAQ